MGAGLRALGGGLVAFVVVTAVLAATDEHWPESRLDAVTTGGLAGGGVALAIWLASTAGGRGDDATTT